MRFPLKLAYAEAVLLVKFAKLPRGAGHACCKTRVKPCKERKKSNPSALAFLGTDIQ